MNVLLAQLFASIRVRPFISAAFALVVLLGGANYVLWHQHRAVVLRHAEALRNGQFMVRALNGRAKITSDLATLSEGILHIEDNLIDERSMEANLGYFYRFERMTRTHLVRLNQLATPVTASNSRFKAVPFSLQLTGPYLNCMNFLRALENGPRILRIRNCSFERTVETSNDLTLSLTVDVLANL